jgi:cytoskeletal protein RodZ
MMDELGHILREARETKGLTLAEVEAQIRINARFLEALEDGEHDVLPTPAHVRGFLRNYARFLGLDAQPLLDRYQHDRGHGPMPVTREIRERDVRPEPLLPPRHDQPFFDPVNVDVDNGLRRDPESLLRLVIIAALIVTLALVGSRFIPMLMGNGDGTEAVTESINQILEDISNGASSTAEAETSSEPALSGSEIITSTSRNNFDESIPTPFPTRPPLPATLETIPLKLEITERTWMEVTIDGDTVFSGIARRGDPPYEFEAQREAKVVTGNAIGIFITIDDIPLGRMGNRGEAKEEVWRTTN